MSKKSWSLSRPESKKIELRELLLNDHLHRCGNRTDLVASREDILVGCENGVDGFAMQIVDIRHGARNHHEFIRRDEARPARLIMGGVPPGV